MKSSSSLRPFVVAFKFLLIPFTRISPVLNVTFCVLHALVLICIASTATWYFIISVERKTDGKISDDSVSLSFYVNGSLRGVLFLGNYLWILLNRKKITEFLVALNDQLEYARPECRRKADRVCLALFLLSIVNFCTMNYSQVKYIVKYFVDSDARPNFEGSGLAELVANMVITSIFWIYVQACYMLTTCFYIAICYYLTIILTQPSEWPITKLSTMEMLDRRIRNDIISLELVRRHRSALAILHQMEDLFSFISFLRLCLECVCMIFVFRVVSVPWGGDENAFGIYKTTIVFSIVFMFIVQCLAASHVNEKVLQSIRNIPGADVCICTASYPGQASSQVQVELMMYCTQFAMSPPALTAAKFFVIRRAVILTVLGTILTYTLILYEKE